MAGDLFLGIYLAICSWYDCRTKEIPVWLLGIGVLGGTAYAAGLCIQGHIVWYTALLGIIPGAFMIVYAKATEGKLGEADGWLVIPAGLIHQWEKCALEIAAACSFTFLLALFLVLSKRGTRHTQIPFAPFFLAAVVVLRIAE